MPAFPALFTSGFASGMARYADHYSGQYDTARIVVHISVGGLPPMEAMVDTGAPWCLLDPGMAELLEELIHDAGAQSQQLQTRWGPIEGQLHRVTVSLLAEEGNSLEFETTVLVPTLPPDTAWDRPNFIGLNNFLSRIRFAMDPNENAFYFGLGT
jgi:hypothetical protein